MSASVPPVLDRGDAAGEPSCDGVIRLARYSVYPRATSEHAVQSGVAREIGDGRLALVTSTPESVGELLRVLVQGLGDGDEHTLARVVSCEARGPGRFELLLEALDSHQPRFARARRKA